MKENVFNCELKIDESDIHSVDELVVYMDVIDVYVDWHIYGYDVFTDGLV